MTGWRDVNVYSTYATGGRRLSNFKDTHLSFRSEDWWRDGDWSTHQNSFNDLKGPDVKRVDFVPDFVGRGEPDTLVNYVFGNPSVIGLRTVTSRVINTRLSRPFYSVFVRRTIGVSSVVYCLTNSSLPIIWWELGPLFLVGVPDP